MNYLSLGSHPSPVNKKQTCVLSVIPWQFYLQPSASLSVSGDPVPLMLSTQCLVLLEKETPSFHPQLIWSNDWGSRDTAVHNDVSNLDILGSDLLGEVEV